MIELVSEEESGKMEQKTNVRFVTKTLNLFEIEIKIASWEVSKFREFNSWLHFLLDVF